MGKAGGMMKAGIRTETWEMVGAIARAIHGGMMKAGIRTETKVEPPYPPFKPTGGMMKAGIRTETHLRSLPVSPVAPAG